MKRRISLRCCEKLALAFTRSKLTNLPAAHHAPLQIEKQCVFPMYGAYAER